MKKCLEKNRELETNKREEITHLLFEATRYRDVPEVE